MEGHHFQTVEGRSICIRCLRSEHEALRSRRTCPGIPWHRAGYAPENLYTCRQLAGKGLRPGAEQKSAGIVVTAHGDAVNLYDISQARPRRKDTPAMQAARAVTWARTAAKWRCEHCDNEPANIGELTNWWIKPGLCEECKEMLEWKNEMAKLEARIENDRRDACQWAHKLMQSQDWAIIDTETSELRGVVLEIAIIAPDGSELLDSLIHPDGAHIEEGARAVHGISDQDLERAPRLPEIWPEIQAALASKTLLIAYNSAFDKARIEQTRTRYPGLPQLVQGWDCAMKWYSQYWGDWSNYYGSYRWQRLPGAGHRALEDARAVLESIKGMAATWEHEYQPEPEGDKSEEKP